MNIQKAEEILLNLNIPKDHVDDFHQTLRLSKKEENPFKILNNVLFKNRSDFYAAFLSKYFQIQGCVYINDCRGGELRDLMRSTDPLYSFFYFEANWNKDFIYANSLKDEHLFYISEEFFLKVERKWDFHTEALSGSPKIKGFYKQNHFKIIQEHQFHEIVKKIEEEYQERLMENNAIKSRSMEELPRPEDGILHHVLDFAIEKNASDIHVQVDYNLAGKWVNVDHRVHGDIVPFERDIFYDYKFHEPFIRLVREKCNLDLHEVDGAFGYKGMNWRVNFTQTGWDKDPCVVLRKLDPNSVLIDPEKIFLHPKLMEHIRILQRRYSSGFCLIVGETGSGKTTSIYSFLHDTFQRLEKKKKFKTIEDPIEYPMPRWLCQHQVDARHSADQILKSLLRSDPDWIMAGEIRDADLMTPAKHAVLSGHMTVATFHSGGVFETLLRMKELGMGAKEIAETTRFIMSQSLLQSLCHSCKEKLGEKKYAKGKGCEHCVAGIGGRIAVMEYCLIDPEDKLLFEAIVSENKARLNEIIGTKFLNKAQYVQWAKEEGYLAFDDNQLKI